MTVAEEHEEHEEHGCMAERPSVSSRSALDGGRSQLAGVEFGEERGRTLHSGPSRSPRSRSTRIHPCAATNRWWAACTKA